MVIDAFCINLDRCPENLNNMIKEWENILNIKKIMGIDGNQEGIAGELALYLTNKKLFNDIANDIIEIKKPYFIVIEDDIFKTNNFNLELWNKIIKFAEDNNNKWDIITLDLFLRHQHNNFFPNIEKHNDIFLKVNKFIGAGFMIYNTKFIKNNIEYINTLKMPYDVNINCNEKFIKLTPSKLLTKQDLMKDSTTVNCNRQYMIELSSITEYLIDNCNNPKKILKIKKNI